MVVVLVGKVGKFVHEFFFFFFSGLGWTMLHGNFGVATPTLFPAPPLNLQRLHPLKATKAQLAPGGHVSGTLPDLQRLRTGGTV